MPLPSLRTGEWIALGMAALMHLTAIVLLLLQREPERPPAPEREERMTVNLATDVGLASTAPDPVPESRAPTAPVISDSPGLPDPSPAEFAPAVPEPVPAPPIPDPPRVDRPEPTPKPTPTRRPTRKPTPPAKPKPPVKANTNKRNTAKAKTNNKSSAKKPSTKPKTNTKPRSSSADTRGGGGRLGKDFLDGAGNSSTSNETRVPASQIGSSVKNSLFGSVTRQIKPHWKPPSGPDANKIVTKVRFRLNPDGSLSGSPSVISQTGINATNRAQAKIHGENAVKAVRLASPYSGLPDKYHNAWKTVTITFDWKL